MLILSRKQGEQIRIGDNITVNILRTGQYQVQVGVEAPRDVRVLRAELGPFGDNGASGACDKRSRLAG